MDDDIIGLMKKQGLKITGSRLRVIEAICRCGGFIPDIETFWLDLHAVRPISRAVIYSTMQLMARSGILRAEPREHRLISYRFAAGTGGKAAGTDQRDTLQNAIDMASTND